MTVKAEEILKFAKLWRAFDVFTDEQQRRILGRFLHVFPALRADRKQLFFRLVYDPRFSKDVELAIEKIMKEEHGR